MNKNCTSLHPSFVFKQMGANQRGDAELFKALFKGKFSHQPYKGWFVKQAGGWKPDSRGETYNAVEDVAIEYEQAAERVATKIINLTNSGNVTEAQAYMNLQEAARHRAFWLRSGAGIEACLKMARRDPVFHSPEQ